MGRATAAGGGGGARCASGRAMNHVYSAHTHWFPPTLQLIVPSLITIGLHASCIPGFQD